MDYFKELCRLFNLSFEIFFLLRITILWNCFPSFRLLFFLLPWVNNIELLLFFVCSFIQMLSSGFTVKVKVWAGICSLKVDGFISSLITMFLLILIFWLSEYSVFNCIVAVWISYIFAWMHPNFPYNVYWILHKNLYHDYNVVMSNMVCQFFHIFKVNFLKQ